MRPATASTHIANQLRARIRSGEYPHQSALPPETALAAEFGTARNTVRRAIETLVHEGLLRKSQGRRTVVDAPPTAVRTADGKLAWFSYLRPSFMYSNQIYFELFQRMVELAQERGLSVQFLNPALIANWDPEFWSAPEWRGLFSVGMSAEQSCSAFIPRLQTLPNLITIDENDSMTGTYTVTTDNYATARIATAHLLESGCRKLVFLRSDVQTGRSFRERQSGYEAAIRETLGECAGSVFILSNVGKNVLQFYQGIENFLQNRGDVDGVFCASDEIALLLVEAALRYRVRVPEKLKIVGFDGTYAAQHTTPKLTTVSQPLADIAANALMLALDLSSGQHRSPCTIRLPGYLMHGETT